MTNPNETTETIQDAPSRNVRGVARAAIVIVVLAAVPLLLAAPASAYSPQPGVYDNGWSCGHSRSASGSLGSIRFKFPQMTRNNGNVLNEGVWVRPVVMKKVKGRWQYYSDVTVVGLTGRYGMLSTSVFGTWMKLNSSITLNDYRVTLTPGEYAILVQYRWESTGWGSFASVRNDGSNAATCVIPK